MIETFNDFEAFLSHGILNVVLILLPVASIVFAFFKPRLDHLSKARYRRRVSRTATALSLNVNQRIEGSLVYLCLLWLVYIQIFSLIAVAFMIIMVADLISNVGVLGVWGTTSALCLAFVFFTIVKTFDQAAAALRNGWHPRSRMTEIAGVLSSDYRSDWLDESTKRYVAGVLASVQGRLDALDATTKHSTASH